MGDLQGFGLLVPIPLLRPLRLLRLLSFVRVLNRTAAGSLTGKASAYVIGTACLSIGLGAVTVLDAERGASGANITTFGDALWWAVTTATTVSYGDRLAVTLEGRLLAFALMVVGISVVGLVTASAAAWLIANVQRPANREAPRASGDGTAVRSTAEPRGVRPIAMSALELRIS